ncbi:ABC transporter permease, partial [Mesorhizobium sp. M7A.F.Ca.ET.027.03.2.1]
METAIPVLLLIVVSVAMSFLTPDFLTLGGISDTLQQAAEIGFVVLGLTLVMIVGGIDLSVGSIFALCNFVALYLIGVVAAPFPVVILATIACGCLLGLVNGILIGYFRLRAFLTTLITLIIYRATYDMLILDHALEIAGSLPDSQAWELLSEAAFLGFPLVAWVYAAVAIYGHVFLTRLRPGWHINAIGGARRSAYNSGINVRRTVTLT